MLSFSRSGDPVDPTFLIHSAASNVICCVLFGERFDYGDKVHARIINIFKENGHVANGAWAAVCSLLNRLFLIIPMIHCFLWIPPLVMSQTDIIH